MVITKDVYWARREQCTKGKHKLRDNNYGITWCITCGFLSNKTCNTPLLEEEKIITTNL